MDVRSPGIALALWCLMALPSPAAPFVAGEPQSLAARLAATRAAVIAERIAADGATTGWRVIAVLRDETDAVAVGQTLQPRPVPPEDATLVLLLSNRDRTVVAEPLSDEAAAYVQSITDSKSPAESRLKHALAHLGQSDPFIAADAIAVLSSCTSEELRRHRELLPRDRLLARIEDGATPGDQVGFYGYLVGLCGTPDDARRLRRRLLTNEGFATGAEGVAAGYLLLTGEAGLTDLETHVLMTEHTPPLLACAVLDAIARLRAEGDGRFTAARLRQAACCGLERIDVADLAVGHLVAAKEWEALPDVVALLEPADANPDRARAGQVTAVRFLIECRRDADAPTDLRAAASRLLDEIAVTDADLLRRATHLSGEPRPRH